jgi:hypothetical protein
LISNMGKAALDFLIFNEIISQSKVGSEYFFETTKLGNAIIKSGLSPEEGLLVYIDL